MRLNLVTFLWLRKVPVFKQYYIDNLEIPLPTITFGLSIIIVIIIIIYYEMQENPLLKW